MAHERYSHTNEHPDIQSSKNEQEKELIYALRVLISKQKAIYSVSSLKLSFTERKNHTAFSYSINNPKSRMFCIQKATNTNDRSRKQYMKSRLSKKITLRYLFCTHQATCGTVIKRKGKMHNRTFFFKGRNSSAENWSISTKNENINNRCTQKIHKLYNSQKWTKHAQAYNEMLSRYSPFQCLQT